MPRGFQQNRLEKKRKKDVIFDQQRENDKLTASLFASFDRGKKSILDF